MVDLRDYLKNACEEIDAGVFSGDVLYCDDERKELKEYVERWARAIASHEQDESSGLPDNAGNDPRSRVD